jgi:hypothetical protein
LEVGSLIKWRPIPAENEDGSVRRFVEARSRVNTLWGYIAWRIAGNGGLKLVAEAEAARTSPGSELMVEVFKLAGPSVILLDEQTMFAANSTTTTASRHCCRSSSRSPKRRRWCRAF